MGRFFARDAGEVCVSAQTARSFEPGALPVVDGVQELLPKSFTLGDFRFSQAYKYGFEALPSDWSVGQGAYSSSLAEFGRQGLEVADGHLKLSLRAKTEGEPSRTDRPFWGAEVRGPVAFGHGLFLARIRTVKTKDAILGFFMSTDKFTPQGQNLGWTGAVIDLTDSPQLRLVFHNSALNQHFSRPGPYPQNVDPDSAQWHTYALLSLPGQVSYYVDGQKLHTFTGVDAAAPWSFQFTHWINRSEGVSFDPSVLPVVGEVDFVAHYEVALCPAAE